MEMEKLFENIYRQAKLEETTFEDLRNDPDFSHLDDDTIRKFPVLQSKNNNTPSPSRLYKMYRELIDEGWNASEARASLGREYMIDEGTFRKIIRDEKGKGYNAFNDSRKWKSKFKD